MSMARYHASRSFIDGTGPPAYPSFPEVHGACVEWARHYAKCDTCSRRDWYNPTVTLYAIDPRAHIKEVHSLRQDAARADDPKVAARLEQDADRKERDFGKRSVAGRTVSYRSLWPLEDVLCDTGIDLLLRWEFNASRRSGQHPIG